VVRLCYTSAINKTCCSLTAHVGLALQPAMIDWLYDVLKNQVVQVDQLRLLELVMKLETLVELHQAPLPM
jgi:hypothetical protein